MDIKSVLDSSFSPLSIEEIKKYSGSMYSDERMESLIRSGEINIVPGTEGVYYCVPAILRKRTSSQNRKNVAPMDSKSRDTEISSILSLQTKLDSVVSQITELNHKKDEFPTEEEINAHIKRLHVYNERRDEGTKLIEQLANMEGCSVHAIYERFDIDKTMLK